VDDATNWILGRPHHLIARHQYFPPDQRSAIEHLRRAQCRRQRRQGVLHLMDAAHRAELGELTEKLARIHRLERVLILQLRNHQLQKLLLPELILLLDCARVSRCCACRSAVAGFRDDHRFSRLYAYRRTSAGHNIPPERARWRATRTRLRNTFVSLEKGVLLCVRAKATLLASITFLLLYCPSRSVANIISFAVFMTSTLFWYERAAEIMLTSSSTVLTFGA